MFEYKYQVPCVSLLHLPTTSHYFSHFSNDKMSSQLSKISWFSKSHRKYYVQTEKIHLVPVFVTNIKLPPTVLISHVVPVLLPTDVSEKAAEDCPGV